MKFKIYSLLLLLALMGCVSEFNANIPLSGTNILVVEGHIVANSTVEFNFSKSFGLDEDYPPEGYDDVSVNLVIVGDDGSRSSYAEYMGSGVHRIDVGALDPNTAYGIEFEYEGNTYRSELSKPLKTPEIDEVTWVQPVKEGEVAIRVSTQGDNSESHSYYLWDYMEDWEITVNYPSAVFFDATTDPPYFYLDLSYPFLYCWKKYNNKDVLVGTTETLKENKVVDKKLFSREADDRFSYLYRVIVRQQAISKAAYEYYLDKSKSNTGMGGLFTPQPSKIEGNITCITDNGKNVIGFVEVVNNIVEASMYISSTEVSIPPNYIDCDGQDFSDVTIYPTDMEPYLELYSYGFRPSSYVYLGDKPFATLWVKARCTDCTAKGGVKRKPENWPNDHE